MSLWEKLPDGHDFMTIDLDAEIARLRQMTVSDLHHRYAELFDDGAEPPGNKVWLIRRIAWHLQALAEGGLSERARLRAAELASDAKLRLCRPRTASEAAPGTGPSSDPRLPRPGTTLVREYKDQSHEVQVLSEGFAYQRTVYRSLSAVAKAITGSHCNGFLFFRLIPQEKPRAKGR